MEGVRGSNPLSSTEGTTEAPGHALRPGASVVPSIKPNEEEGDEGARRSPLSSTDRPDDGSGIGNFGGVDARLGEWGAFPARATVQVPPLGAVFFRLDEAEEAAPKRAVEDDLGASA